jgi:hypothetical protein
MNFYTAQGEYKTLPDDGILESFVPSPNKARADSPSSSSMSMVTFSTGPYLEIKPPYYTEGTLIRFTKNRVVFSDITQHQYTLEDPSERSQGEIIQLINASPVSHNLYAGPNNFWINKYFNKIFIPAYGSVTLYANLDTYIVMNIFNSADTDVSWALVRVNN